MSSSPSSSSTSSPLLKPAILRHVIKFAVQSPQDGSLLTRHPLRSLATYIQVCVDWKDTIFNYSTGTIATAVLPKDQAVFVVYFYRVCKAMNKLADMLFSRTNPVQPTPGRYRDDMDDEQEEEEEREEEEREEEKVEDPVLLSRMDFLLEFVIKSLILREWTEHRLLRPNRLIKNRGEGVTCLRWAVNVGNVKLVRFIVENLNPNLDAECNYIGTSPINNYNCSTFNAAVKFPIDKVAAELVEILADAYLKLEARRNITFRKRRPRKSTKAAAAHSDNKPGSCAFISARYRSSNRTCLSIFDEPGIFFPPKESPSSVRHYNFRPLVWAVSYRNVRVIQLLLNKYRCCPNKINDEPSPPLFTTSILGIKYKGLFESLSAGMNRNIDLVVINAFICKDQYKGPYPVVDLFARPFPQKFVKNPSLSVEISDDDERKQYESLASFATIRAQQGPQFASDGREFTELLKLIFETDPHHQLASLFQPNNLLKLITEECGRQENALEFILNAVPDHQKEPSRFSLMGFDEVKTELLTSNFSSNWENVLRICVLEKRIHIMKILVEKGLVSSDQLKEVLKRKPVNDWVDSALKTSNRRRSKTTKQVDVFKFLVEECGLRLGRYLVPLELGGGTLLHHLCQKKGIDSTRQADEVLEYVLSLKILDVNEFDRLGRTPLIICLEQDKNEEAKKQADLLKKYRAESDVYLNLMFKGRFTSSA